jgi:hypothetical protein
MKCKICKSKFKPKRFLQKNCNNHSAKELAEWSRKQRKDKEDRSYRKMKRVFYENDIPIRKKAAKLACHGYIRARDAHLPCITCDKPLGTKYDAGHFLSSGSHSYTRYMEKNIHAQCVNCNQFNGGKPREYEIALRVKYGSSCVEALLKAGHRMVKRTAQDYKAIETYYKDKLKQLK